MKKKIQVVMLPTNEKAGYLQTLFFNGNLFLSNYSEPHQSKPSRKYQYLYFLSDEEIKEGDWFIDSDKKIKLCIGFKKAHGGKPYVVVRNEENAYDQTFLKKIIATTDESLRMSIDMFEDKEVEATLPFPKLSKSFLEQYVKAYNEGKQIKEVMVEYEEHALIEYNKPRTNSKDNTIAIHLTKDNWTREEVVVLVTKMQHDFIKYKDSCHYGPNMREIADWTNEWIEQNL